MSASGLLDFAAGNLDALAARYLGAGLVGGTLAPGVLEMRCPERPPTAKVALSVGVHGDETAPIEMLYRLFHELAEAGAAPGCDLLLIVANLEAIALGRRFVDTDMNRHFREGANVGGSEGARAAVLRGVAERFFSGGDAPAIHLDLHTTIKPSLYPQFAIVPPPPDARSQRWLLGWLGAAEIEVAIQNDLPSATFSGFSARVCGAASATLELGTIGRLGSNDLSPLAGVERALRALVQRGPQQGSPGGAESCIPRRFAVGQEIVRRSERFILHLAPDAPNFTAFQRGERIAEDDFGIYTARQEREHIVFPNASVAVGQRAGLMVHPID